MQDAEKENTDLGNDFYEATYLYCQQKAVERRSMTNMSMKEAMYKRHTVRKYTDKAIPAEITEQLNRRITENNQKYNLAIRFKENDTNAFHSIIKLILAKGVKNYFIMVGEDAPDLDERLGYSGADLMLYAQTLGLNTWWVGGTFNRKKISGMIPGAKVIGVIAVGYGATQGAPHKTKKSEEVSSYHGTAPSWFRTGVEAALLAPTALAKQAFFIKGKGHGVSITCDNGIFSGADKGLIKYHFELGAGKGNFDWVPSVDMAEV